MPNKRTIPRVCGRCQSDFLATVSAVNAGNARFCGLSCAKKAYHRAGPDRGERFNRKVARSADCWVWTGAVLDNGYGRFDSIGAHQAAWEIATGEPIPDGLSVLHTCDVRHCVRNDDIGTYLVAGRLRPRRGHLFVGTQADNMADMAAKGRSASGDRHSSVLYPERCPRGDQNGMRLHPESVLRGERNARAKLTLIAVQDILTRYAAGGISQPQLASEYGVHQATIWRILHKKAWPEVV